MLNDSVFAKSTSIFHFRCHPKRQPLDQCLDSDHLKLTTPYSNTSSEKLMRRINPPKSDKMAPFWATDERVCSADWKSVSPNQFLQLLAKAQKTFSSSPHALQGRVRIFNFFCAKLEKDLRFFLITNLLQNTNITLMPK